MRGLMILSICLSLSEKIQRRTNSFMAVLFMSILILEKLILDLRSVLCWRLQFLFC